MRLTILQAASSSGRWCAGSYTGAVYAVPHAPPCRSGYYCYGTSAQSGPCWILEEGRRVCGVVAKPADPVLVSGTGCRSRWIAARASSRALQISF